jgi:DNA-binding CsgD family transcriptional regulator/PAS domain-containing protein
MERSARLADLFYEAALEPELWAPAIEELTDYVGTSSVSVLSAYEAPHDARLIASVRYDSENWKQVQADHSSPETNHYIQRFLAARVGEVIWPRRLLSRAEWHEDPIIRKFLRPDRLADGLAVPIRKTRTGFTAVAVFSTRAYTQRDVDLLQSISVDLSRAFRMSEKLSAVESIRYAATAIFDAISPCVILLDRQGRMVHANASARALFTRDDGISVGRLGQMAVSDRRAGIKLSEMIRAAIVSATRGHRRWSDSEVEPRISGTLAVPRPRGGHPYTVVVVPVRAPPAVGLPAGSDAVTCVLFITDPDSIDPVEATHLSAAYGFTPTEAGIVAHLVAGHSLRHTAATMGMTLNSAKTLLGRAFERCHVSRQSDLVALVLRGPLGFVQRNRH